MSAFSTEREYNAIITKTDEGARSKTNKERNKI